MLPRDKGGVVDPRLKVRNYLRSYPCPFTYSRAIIRGRQVYGTHNLRVVDLSILPLHIGAPTQSTSLPCFHVCACANV
jgi:hypothetical protein